jgi:hypothetical protein
MWRQAQYGLTRPAASLIIPEGIKNIAFYEMGMLL